MDSIDKANDVAEVMVGAAMTEIDASHKDAEETGFCLFCGDPIKEKGRRWCDAECRDAWEKEHRR